MRRGCLVLTLICACSGGGPSDAIDAPAIDALDIDAPTIDAPDVDAPDVDAPDIDALDVDAPAIDAPAIDAPDVDAPAIDAPTIDAPAIDAPPVDAPPPVDAAIDAPLFLSPRYDPSYGTAGVACPQEGRYMQFLFEIPHADGSVTYCHTGASDGVQPAWRTCRPDGTFGFIWGMQFIGGCARLPDGRLVGHAISPGNPGAPPGFEPILDVAGFFVDVVDRGDHLDYIRRDSPILRVADDNLWFPMIATFPAAPSYDRIHPCSATHHLIHTTGSTIIRVDAATWTVDPTYGTGGAVTVPAAYVMRPDCSLVTVSAGSTRVTTYDADGHSPSSFDVPLTDVNSAALDPAGRLIVGLPSTETATVRVARLDLAAGALDPAFGLGGVAELQVPGVAWTTVGFTATTYVARVLAARSGAITISVTKWVLSTAMPPPMGYYSTGIRYVKLVVD